MKTLLEKKKDVINVAIIILLAISIPCLVYASWHHNIKKKAEYYREHQTLCFIHITNGKDTCLVSSDMESTYYELNLKVLDQESFDYWLMKNIHNNEIIEVSDEYYKEFEKYAIYPVDKITDLYVNYGIDSFVSYLYHYPIHQLYKEDVKSFDWASYLLWQNDIHVSLDYEAFWFYIDMDEYRCWHE